MNLLSSLQHAPERHKRNVLIGISIITGCVVVAVWLYHLRALIVRSSVLPDTVVIADNSAPPQVFRNAASVMYHFLKASVQWFGEPKEYQLK